MPKKVERLNGKTPHADDVGRRAAQAFTELTSVLVRLHQLHDADLRGRALLLIIKHGTTLVENAAFMAARSAVTPAEVEAARTAGREVAQEDAILQAGAA